MTVALAVIELAFDPFLRLQGLAIPWRAVGIAGSVLIALLVAVVIARRGKTERPAARPDPAVEGADPGKEAADGRSPRGAAAVEPDDLLYIVVGAVPGAVVLGRLVHGLTYLDVYGRDPMALLDPARGSLSLLGAVAGGALTAAYVASTLGVSVRRAADIAAVPMLLSIALGKLSQLLAGAGQGSGFDGPWAVAFIGPGPWMSVAPGAPAHPSQAYEGLWALLGVPFLLMLGSWMGRRRIAGFGARGALFLVALAWWLVGRIAVGFTWRDDLVVGPLNAEQLLAVAVLAATVLALAAAGLLAPGTVARASLPEAGATDAAAANPDPGTSLAEPGTSGNAGASGRDQPDLSRSEGAPDESRPEGATKESGPDHGAQESPPGAR